MKLLFQDLLDLMALLIQNLFSSQKYEIESWFDVSRERSNGCPKDPLSLVPLNRSTNVVFSRHTNSGDVRVVFFGKQYDKRVGIWSSFMSHPFKINRSFQLDILLHKKSALTHGEIWTNQEFSFSSWPFWCGCSFSQIRVCGPLIGGFSRHHGHRWLTFSF